MKRIIEAIFSKVSSWLLPILAILVILQAIALGFGWQKEKKQEIALKNAIPTSVLKPLATVTPIKEALTKFSFSPTGISIKNGQSAKVDLVLSPKKGLKLDGMDVVLTFDPKFITVTKVTTPKLFSFVSESKNKEAEGKLFFTFLEEKDGGLWVAEDTVTLTLEIKGKTIGEGQMTILRSEEGPTTVLVETATSKKILFEKEDLKVVVY